MTLARDMKRLAAKMTRKARNVRAKETRKAARSKIDIHVPEIVEPRSIPRLSWLNGKTHPQHTGGRKGLSQHLSEHITAISEHASRKLTDEITKALVPSAEVSSPDTQGEVTQ
jgi:hypothetical protein